MPTYVKTVYGGKGFKRAPNITKYKRKRDADTFIKTALKWGIDIVSCEIINPREAKELIKSHTVQYEEE